MKIFLTNPPCRIPLKGNRERYFIRAGSRWPFSVIKKRAAPLDYLPFPFYLAYTAALLEKNNFQVETLDSIALNQKEEEFLQEVRQSSPDIILFETSTPTIKKDLMLAKKIKGELSCTICLAGAHVSHFPKTILKNNRYIDYVFLREYEINFLNFCLAIRNKSALNHLKGIAFRDKDQIVIKKCELIDPLDDLPMPAWHLFPSRKKANPTLYWDAFCQYKPAVQLHASRGCPFRCNFCLWNQVIYRNGKYRTFHPQRIVDEMEYVQKRYDAKEVYFDDDTFTGNKEHVLLICDEILKRNLKIYWSIMGDAMITDQEMLIKMAQAGCIGMKFGVESGNEEILKKIGKPINFERIKKVAHLCSKFHIKTHATFTFGLLNETRETMNQTLNFAKELDVDSVQFSINTPFPGTRFYQEAKQKKMILTNDWSQFDGSNNAVANFENVTNEEVEKMYCHSSSSWLKHKLQDPQWISRQTYNFYRLVKGQGITLGLNKIKRLVQLIYS